jgi:RNA polymerase sigma-70 factor (ECF subfamily)
MTGQSDPPRERTAAPPDEVDVPGTGRGSSRRGASDRRPEPSAVPTIEPPPSTRHPDRAEAELVTKAGSGDREAFRQLVESHQGRVLGLAMRMLGARREAAEDICQEVFLRAWRALPRFDNGVRFMTWLHKITVNACISEIRSRRASKRDGHTISIDAPTIVGDGDDGPTLDPAENRPGSNPLDRAHESEFVDAVRHALASVPEEFRTAVLLRDMQGLSYEEISDILGVPRGTVRSRIHRGRLHLQQILEGYRP